MKAQKVGEVECQLARGKLHVNVTAKLQGAQAPTVAITVKKVAETRGGDVIVSGDTNMGEIKRLRDELTELIDFMRQQES